MYYKSKSGRLIIGNGYMIDCEKLDINPAKYDSNSDDSFFEEIDEVEFSLLAQQVMDKISKKLGLK